MLNGTRISGIESSKTLIRSFAGSDLYITDAVFEDLIIKNVLKGGVIFSQNSHLQMVDSQVSNIKGTNGACIYAEDLS